MNTDKTCDQAFSLFICVYLCSSVAKNVFLSAPLTPACASRSTRTAVLTGRAGGSIRSTRGLPGDRTLTGLPCPDLSVLDRTPSTARSALARHSLRGG